MRLAPDVIKLDRTIVTGVAGDPVKAALIESFVRYAREIDASVCAEGIEEMADLARLADLDVAYGQGYGISRPAAPWATLSDAAAATCRISFAAMLHGHAIAGGETQDRLLEELAARLAMADSAGDLQAVLGPIARELHADAVRLATPHEILADAGDGLGRGGRRGGPCALARRAGAPQRSRAAGAAAAALAAHGYRSRLLVPVHSRGTVLGTLEAYSIEERPWSRFEIRRARIIANALGGALAHVHAEAPGGALAHVHAEAPGGAPVGRGGRARARAGRRSPARPRLTARPAEFLRFLPRPRPAGAVALREPRVAHRHPRKERPDGGTRPCGERRLVGHLPVHELRLRALRDRRSTCRPARAAATGSTPR